MQQTLGNGFTIKRICASQGTEVRIRKPKEDDADDD